MDFGIARAMADTASTMTQTAHPAGARPEAGGTGAVLEPGTGEARERALGAASQGP
ncbi:hypothetical protein GCM10023178_75130 [Actinomadura luteofluorescens]